MSKIWQQLATIWGRLEIPQRATIVLVGLAFLGAVVALWYGATRPDYRMLAQGLDKAHIAEIAAYLDSTHISYQVADRETTILVPSKELYRLRNELAERDMLGDGSKGFELLAKSNMWDTTFTEHKNYDRAVAGELERSFRELPGVRSARVLIDRPQPSPFIDADEGKPKASIKLDMKPGTRLSDRQVAGILHLTAGAIAGLGPERVEIMDNGGLLTPAAANSGAQLAQTTLEAEAARETYLTRKAQDLLDATLGPGRSSVKVSVKLDFTKRSSTTTDPTTKVLTRENTRTSDEKTPAGGNGGVAGTAPNVEGESRPAGAVAQLATKTSEETRNEYTVGSSHTVQEDEVGKVRGMTVSILLDQKITKGPKLDDKGQPTKDVVEKHEDYSEVEKKRFQDLVLGAIGFNAAKGSQGAGETPAMIESRFSVAVQSMAMWHEPVEMVAASAIPLGLGGSMLDYIGYGLVGVVALGMMFIARGQLKRSHVAWTQAEERGRREAEEAEKRRQVDSKKETPDTAADLERHRRTLLRDQIKKMVSEDPTSAAQIMRKWLYE